MSPLLFLTYCSVSILYLVVIFQPVYSESLKFNRKEKTSLQFRRIRRKASLEDQGTSGQEEIVSPCPDGEEFCESPEDYPTNTIKGLLKKQPKFILEHFYVEVDDDYFQPGSGSEAGGIAEEYGDMAPVIDWPLCSSMNKIIFPKKARSNEGFFEFIVNDEEHQQGVRVESCVSSSANEGCNIPGSLSLGYTSRCVQQYIQRILVVLNISSSAAEGFVTKPFEFPSCCSCTISTSLDADVYNTTPAYTDWSNTTSTSPDQILNSSNGTSSPFSPSTNLTNSGS